MKQTFPGMLDQCVAGGQPFNMGLFENVVKECMEEASIPEEIAKNASPVSVSSYCYDVANIGLKPEVLFNYDLEVPQDFQPKPLDGEVEAIYAWDPMTLLRSLDKEPEGWKTNSALVNIDFLIRHGFLSGDECPVYSQLTRNDLYASGIQHFLNRV